MTPKVDEYVVMQCSDESCPYVRIIIGPNSRQPKRNLDNIKCLRCEQPMTLFIDYSTGVHTKITTNNVLVRNVIHECEGKKLEEFWRTCEVWKAIHDEINKAEIGGSLFAHKKHHIRHSSAHSGIRLKMVYPFCMGAKKKYDNVRFCYDVSYRDDDPDRSVRDYCEHEMIDVPVSLVVNFTQPEFDEFSKTRHKIIVDRELEYQREALKDLVTRIPELRNKLMKDPELAEMLEDDDLT